MFVYAENAVYSSVQLEKVSTYRSAGFPQQFFPRCRSCRCRRRRGRLFFVGWPNFPQFETFILVMNR